MFDAHVKRKRLTQMLVSMNFFPKFICSEQIISCTGMEQILLADTMKIVLCLQNIESTWHFYDMNLRVCGGQGCGAEYFSSIYLY